MTSYHPRHSRTDKRDPAPYSQLATPFPRELTPPGALFQVSRQWRLSRHPVDTGICGRQKPAGTARTGHESVLSAERKSTGSSECSALCCAYTLDRGAVNDPIALLVCPPFTAALLSRWPQSRPTGYQREQELAIAKLRRPSPGLSTRSLAAPFARKRSHPSHRSSTARRVKEIDTLPIPRSTRMDKRQARWRR